MSMLTENDFRGWTWGRGRETGTPHKQYGYQGSEFECYFWRNGWRHVSFGVSLYLGGREVSRTSKSLVTVGGPNVEIHVWGGFLRVGRPIHAERLSIRGTLQHSGAPDYERLVR